MVISNSLNRSITSPSDPLTQQPFFLKCKPIKHAHNLFSSVTRRLPHAQTSPGVTFTLLCCRVWPDKPTTGFDSALCLVRGAFGFVVGPVLGCLAPVLQVGECGRRSSSGSGESSSSAGDGAVIHALVIDVNRKSNVPWCVLWCMSYWAARGHRPRDLAWRCGYLSLPPAAAADTHAPNSSAFNGVQSERSIALVALGPDGRCGLDLTAFVLQTSGGVVWVWCRLFSKY